MEALASVGQYGVSELKEEELMEVDVGIGFVTGFLVGVAIECVSQHYTGKSVAENVNDFCKALNKGVKNQIQGPTYIT